MVRFHSHRRYMAKSTVQDRLACSSQLFMHRELVRQLIQRYSRHQS